MCRIRRDVGGGRVGAPFSEPEAHGGAVSELCREEESHPDERGFDEDGRLLRAEAVADRIQTGERCGGIALIGTIRDVTACGESACLPVRGV